jgi:hypothetical protein
MSVLVVCYLHGATNAKISHRALGNRLYNYEAGDMEKLKWHDVDRAVRVIRLKVESPLHRHVVDHCKSIGNVDIG